VAEPPQAVPPIDFSTFCLSLASNVLMFLGEMPDPDDAKPEVNLPLARQSIDILAMLEEKTRGNLAEAEAKLLESLLYDLRVKYVDAQKRGGK
jgi:hypothetical protein